MSITLEQCRAARDMLDMRRQDLAVASRVSHSALSDLEKGRYQPGHKTLVAIRSASESAGVRSVRRADGKRYAEAAGLDPHEFAGHNLRAEFLTSAAEAGADVLRLMEVSRHKRFETVQGYVRRANGFKGHAGQAFL